MRGSGFPPAVSPKGVLFHAEICHPARRGRGGGLVGLLVRRVYLAHGFEAGTGLPISGAPSLWAMVLVSAAVAAALLVLSRGKHRKFDQCYTGAFSPDTTPLLSGALARGGSPGHRRLFGPGRLGRQPPYPAGTADDEHCLGRAGGSQPAGRRRHLLCRPENAPGRPHSHRLGRGPRLCLLPVDHGPTTTRAGRRSPCWVST